MAARTARSARSSRATIPYHALCEHHAFPFFGHAFVAYVAHEQIIGKWLEGVTAETPIW